MALVEPRLDAGRLVLSAPGMRELAIPLRDGGSRVTVSVWRDTLEAWSAGEDAATWWSDLLGRRAALVRFADDVLRQVDPTRARPGDAVGFADGFSFLLATEASLAALNERLAEPVTMRRFRPNLVVAGSLAPFEEDGWRRIRIGEIELEVAKPCGRCSIVTVDPATGVRGKEPLATLSTFRREGKEVLFGQNLIHRGRGRLAVGDEVTVLA